jgi:2-dehydropantoate 2-reductase
VAFVGVGSVGTFFAAHLARKGVDDLVLCVRRPFDELVLESGGAVLRSKPRVVTDPTELAGEPPADWVVFATKAHQTGGAAGWLDALSGPGTRIAVLQNGVEHVERVQPFAPESIVVPTVVYCGAEQVRPGHAVHRAAGFLIAADDENGQALAALFDGTPAGVRLTDDLATALWTKLCSNVVANGITGLTMRRMDVFRDEQIGAFGCALARECLAVGRAEGAQIDDAFADALLAGMAAVPEDSGTSMLYDRLASRPLEVDALHGAVQRAAVRHGIDVPRHDAMAALLTAVSGIAVRLGPSEHGGR